MSLSPCCNWHGRMEQHVQPSPGVKERVKRNQRKWARCHWDPKKCAGIQRMREQAVCFYHRETQFPPTLHFVFFFPMNMTLLVVVILCIWPKAVYFSNYEYETSHLWCAFPVSCARHWCHQETVSKQDCLNGNIGEWKKEKDLVKSEQSFYFYCFLISLENFLWFISF